MNEINNLGSDIFRFFPKEEPTKGEQAIAFIKDMMIASSPYVLSLIPYIGIVGGSVIAERNFEKIVEYFKEDQSDKKPHEQIGLGRTISKIVAGGFINVISIGCLENKPFALFLFIGSIAGSCAYNRFMKLNAEIDNLRSAVTDHDVVAISRNLQIKKLKSESDKKDETIRNLKSKLAAAYKSFGESLSSSSGISFSGVKVDCEPNLQQIK